MAKDLVKRAPENLRKLQIGQVYDAALNKVKEIYCLDLQSLYDDKKVMFSNDEVIEYYSFKDYSGEKTDHSVFEIGGGVKGGGPAVSLAAAYNYYNEKASMLKENTLNAEIYKVKKVSIWLVNIENGTDFINHLYDNTTIKKEYHEIQMTKAPDLKKVLIEQFKIRWGTGLVTKLQLMGGATAEISFTSKSNDEKSKTIHEAELSFESRFVSAEGKLKLNKDIQEFNLSVDMKGTVTSFPSEVKGYKDYVEAQIKYLKEYIEKKSISATAPQFTDASRKPITIKDLKLKEGEKDSPDQLAAKMRKKIEKLEEILDDPDFEDILLAIEDIETLDEELPEVKKLKPIFLSRFDECKKEFKKGFVKIIEGMAKSVEKKIALTDDETTFLGKVKQKITRIKAFKIIDEKKEGATKKLFTDDDMDGLRTFIKKNVK